MQEETLETGLGTGGLVIGSMLTTAARKYRDREMLYCASTHRRYTFGQMNTRVNRLADGLTRMGLAPGDTVAFLLDNRAELVEMYFALAKAGLVGLPLNYRLAPAEVVDLVDTCRAQLLVYADRFRATGDAVHAARADVVRLVEVGTGPPAPGVRRYEDVIAAGTDVEPDVAVDQSDTEYFNLTSGTTGMPKVYRLSHFNNAVAALTMSVEFDITVDDTVLTVFPMYGRVGAAWMLMATSLGIRHVITDYEPGRVGELIETERCTITNFVPTMAAMLMQAPETVDRDLTSLRAIVFAGSPLPETVREDTLARLCPNLYEYYGMQETGLVTAIDAADKRERPESVGQTNLFSEVRVVDELRRPVPTGESGEIIVRTPTSTTAYYRNETRTRETFRDGWIHTGDIGRFDADGFLYITGRQKDVIVTGGQNVFSVEVEGALLGHDGVEDCAVFALPDPVWGEAVTAVVIARDGAEVTESALTAHCRQTLAGFKVPKRIIVRSEEIPRTPTGKITKYVLEEQYAGKD